MRGYSHLSDDEREQIGLLKVLGHSIGAIARAIRHPKSTISRELSRNRLSSGRYSPLHAAGAYQLRRRREALIEKDRALRSFVVDRLAEGWTPEQIAGWLKAGNERRLRAVGCETIYAFIHRVAQQAEQPWRYLTRRHKRRRPRRSKPSRDTIKVSRPPSMNGPKISTPEPRLVREGDPHLQAQRPVSFSMSANPCVIARSEARRRKQLGCSPASNPRWQVHYFLMTPPSPSTLCSRPYARHPTTWFWTPTRRGMKRSKSQCVVATRCRARSTSKSVRRRNA